MQITLALLGLQRRFGRWTLNDGSAALGCRAVLGETYGPGKPIIPYGSLSDRHGVLSADEAIPMRILLDIVLPLKKFTPIGKVFVLYDAQTDLPRICLPVVGEVRRRKPRWRPSRFSVYAVAHAPVNATTHT